MNRQDIAMQLMVKLGEAAAAAAQANSLLAVLAVNDPSLKSHKFYSADNPLYTLHVESISRELGECLRASREYLVGLTPKRDVDQ